MPDAASLWPRRRACSTRAIVAWCPAHAAPIAAAVLTHAAIGCFQTALMVAASRGDIPLVVALRRYGARCVSHPSARQRLTRNSAADHDDNALSVLHHLVRRCPELITLKVLALLLCGPASAAGSINGTDTTEENAVLGGATAASRGKAESGRP